MAEFFMCLECQLQPPFVIMWLKLPKCPLPTLSTPRISSKKITLSLTITIQHVIFMEWLHFTIHQFFKSAMQGISSLFELSMSNSKSKLLLSSHPLIKSFSATLNLRPTISSNLLKPCIRPWWLEQDSVCSVLYASRRVKTCFSIESCEEAPRDSINGALLTPPPASQPGHYIYPSANSLHQQTPPKKINYSKMEIQVS